jgi:formate-dependent nitrite reductase membrane component NrfD
MAEHFVVPPEWTWYILGYFFIGGVSGGTYALATLLRFWGAPEDERVIRFGFLLAFPLLLVCPILLALDLGQPLRFWHMLVQTTPGIGGPAFNAVSPMSVGSWALLIYGALSFISFVAVLGRWESRVPRSGALIFHTIASLAGLFVASYTGVLLSVSNQPVWSDTWMLGGLFLASGLTASAALLAALAGQARAFGAEARLQRADGYFAILELIWLVLFLADLGIAGTLNRVAQTGLLVLWLVVAVAIVISLLGLARARLATFLGPVAAVIVLAGVLALRAVILFSAQI